MVDKFTTETLEVLVFAQHEADSLNHHYIGTEHLLLGILRERHGSALALLESLGVTLEGARTAVANAVAMTASEALPPSRPFTGGAKSAIDFASNEMVRYGHSNIGSDLLLLGIVHARDTAADVIESFGIDLGDLYARVQEMLFDLNREKSQQRSSAQDSRDNKNEEALATAVEAMRVTLVDVARRLARIERHLGVDP